MDANAIVPCENSSQLPGEDADPCVRHVFGRGRFSGSPSDATGSESFHRPSDEDPRHRYGWRSLVVIGLLAGGLLTAAACAGDALPVDVPDAVTNTQVETHPLLPAGEARAAWHLPDGFQVTVFAAEPWIRQPIAMTFDARGRLWVVENDTYADRVTNFDLAQHDRVLIFEDTDGDGQADSRKVFWDQGQKLTSVALGFGGVWLLNAPHLLFISDADGDDIPDGEPEVILDGWSGGAIRHNIVNGLKWGPDGWLYGRHGIQATSHVGLPGAAETDRTPVSCGIWRFHPQREIFEIVCDGTTNPWGHDWTDRGELFMINTVIGHLWHVVPGAHLQRMYGQDFNPHLYQLLPQTADHFHWDTREKWSDIRDLGVTNTTDEAGGGHAHCGMMIYQGDNWPEEYRGDLFTLNFHGRRINRDHLARDGASFVGRHRPDFAATDDLWFRGVDLESGPDGGVYVLDWSDIGECHENDGIHRTSGRIYKITYGSAPPFQQNLANAPDAELVSLQQQPNAWQSRLARRLLQERAPNIRDIQDAAAALKSQLAGAGSVPHRLNALWCLYSMEAVSIPELCDLLDDPDESVRAWAVRLLADRQITDSGILERLRTHARTESSGLVLTYLASALQRLAGDDRLDLAEEILKHEIVAKDSRLALMVWYGIESAVLDHPRQALRIARQTSAELIPRHISRRITEQIRVSNAVEHLLAAIPRTEPDPEPYLRGMAQALEGWRQTPPPRAWEEFANSEIQRHKNAAVTELLRELAVVFGDGRALDDVRRIAGSDDETLDSRRNAIRALVSSRDAESVALLQSLISNRDLAADAIRGLAAFEHEQTAELIIRFYPTYRWQAQTAALATLASRPTFVVDFLSAVRDGAIPAQDVSPFLIRQMRGFPNPEIQQALQSLWPEWRHTSSEKLAKIAEYQSQLTPDVLAKADRSAGRLLFQKTCSTCHSLFGTGGQLGPDLTGAQRSNLIYLLENIVDPSAQVAEKYQMAIMALIDGRVLSGVIVRETEEVLAVQTPTEVVTVVKSDIDAMRNTKLSMMPERQLDVLDPIQVRDLLGYLMSPTQVSLPE